MCKKMEIVIFGLVFLWKQMEISWLNTIKMTKAKQSFLELEYVYT